MSEIQQAKQRSQVFTLQMEVLAGIPTVKQFLELLENKRLNDLYIAALEKQATYSEDKEPVENRPQEGEPEHHE